MITVKFPQSYQKPLGAGDNPNTGDLPRAVCLDKDTPGVCMVLSCWEPSDQELAEIMRSRKVYIGVMASLQRPTQAPISLMGFNPVEAGFYKVVPEEDLKYLGRDNGEESIL